MNENEVILRLYYLGDIQIRLRREIGNTERQLKVLRKELKATEKEMFDLRSTEEYEKTYSKEG